MNAILVSGLINIETTLSVDSFPIGYTPVRYPFHGVHTTISGVGFNITKALVTLGDWVMLLSLVGSGFHGKQIHQALDELNIDRNYVLPYLEETAQSVILYDPTGKRQINVDLKDVQKQSYPIEKLDEVLSQSALAVMCNVNFSRGLLSRVKLANIPIATDVHSISSLDDEYNRDFMAAADVLFCSDELLPCSPEEWADKIMNRYGVSILVIGLGTNGAFLAVRDGKIRQRLPAVHTRPVVNTIGAGDALFSCFLHYHLKKCDPYLSLHKAMIFASHKIGEYGAADGFLCENDLEILDANIQANK